MKEVVFCLAALIVIMLGILFALREIKYQIERLADMFNKKYKYFD